MAVGATVLESRGTRGRTDQRRGAWRALIRSSCKSDDSGNRSVVPIFALDWSLGGFAERPANDRGFMFFNREGTLEWLPKWAAWNGARRRGFMTRAGMRVSSFCLR